LEVVTVAAVVVAFLSQVAAVWLKKNSVAISVSWLLNIY